MLPVRSPLVRGSCNRHPANKTGVTSHSQQRLEARERRDHRRATFVRRVSNKLCELTYQGWEYRHEHRKEFFGPIDSLRDRMKRWIRRKHWQMRAAADANEENNNGRVYSPQASDWHHTDRLFHVLFCALGVQGPGGAAYRDDLSDVFGKVAGELIDTTRTWMRNRRKQGRP